MPAIYHEERKKILEASLWLSEQGYFGSHRGSGGNVSLRVSETAMAITPTSVRYQEMAVDDICVVSYDGQPVDIKTGRKPSIEAGLHGIIYQKRPDVNAVVHTHQIYGSVFALLNMPIPALFDEVCFALGKSIDIIPYAASGSPELAANAGEKLSNNANAYIIQNHGIVALGKDLDKAMLHAELLEKVAHIYCLALSSGRSIGTLPSTVIDDVDSLRNQEVEEAQNRQSK